MKFYSYPPVQAGWGYILRNLKQKQQPFYRHEIVDCGIYDLLNGQHIYSKDMLRKWKSIETDGWIVVPDCPDLTGEFGEEMEFDNCGYSWELLTKYYEPDNPQHLPVIQGHYHDLATVKYYTKIFKREYGTPDKIAVGSLCKNNYFDVAIKIFEFLRKEFPNSWIHGFGIKFKQLRWVHHLIDSTDTTSWTLQRVPWLDMGNKTANNTFEKVDFFYRHIDKLEKMGAIN